MNNVPSHLHEKAKTSFKEVDFSLITTEMLNEKDKQRMTVLHLAAEHGTLNDIPQHLLTEVGLAQTDFFGDTVLHYAAASRVLKHVPSHLLTEKSLNVTGEKNRTVFHVAAKYNSLSQIPVHLLTSNSLYRRDDNGATVLHLAALKNSFEKSLTTLKIEKKLTTDSVAIWQDIFQNISQISSLNDIPEHLISQEAMNYTTKTRLTVWAFAANNKTLKHVPEHLINLHLLSMQTPDGNLFNDNDTKYIKSVVEARKLRFLERHPNLIKTLELADPRLKLTEVTEDSLVFNFSGIVDKVILNKDGAFLNIEKFDTLGHAVSFIENTYPGIEKSIFLPANNALQVKEFVL